MKPLEILSALANPAGATGAAVPSSPDAIFDSPAFAMPCRLGETQTTLRHASVEPSDTLALKILFGEEPHTLAIARSPAFSELDKLWDVRAEVPSLVLLALVEKKCGALFQMLENAVRKQLRLVEVENVSRGGTEGAEAQSAANVANWELAIGTGDTGDTGDILRFSLTRSQTIVSALGVLRNLDLSHESIRLQTLPAEIECAAFQLPEADIASLAPGDAVLLPEIGAVQPCLIVAGLFVVDENGVAPYKDDAMCRVRAVEGKAISLGELFNAAENSPGGAEAHGVLEALGVSASLREAKPVQLSLVRNGKTLAAGRLDRLGEHSAFLVESFFGSR